MTDIALVFVSQFVYVMMLGLQSLNVNGRHYALAATTSSILGALGFWLTAVIAQKPEVGTSIWWAYIAAGPSGICASIYLHPKVKRVYDRIVGNGNVDWQALSDASVADWKRRLSENKRSLFENGEP